MSSLKEIHNKTISDKASMRAQAARFLGENILRIEDKQNAWSDLITLIKDEKYNVRWRAAIAIGQAFSFIPDKQTAWNDLVKLIKDEDCCVQDMAIEALSRVFLLIPDKQAAWNDLINLTKDENCSRGWGAADALGCAFPFMPDKQIAWMDLQKLAKDENGNVRSRAADALGQAFPFMPDKQIAWIALHILTKDEDWNVRYTIPIAIGQAFSLIPDKETAWLDLHNLINDEVFAVRGNAIEALGDVFPHIHDRQIAWKDLHKFATDGDMYIRLSVAYALGQAFPYIPNKKTAWIDLHKLAKDEECVVRSTASDALGQAFPYIPNKKTTWVDLHKLAKDEDWETRSNAVYALGRVSIFKAINAKNSKSFKDNIEKAIEFFDRASNMSEYANPAAFCLPFYRSLHILLFTTKSEDAEIQRYLSEARDATEESKSKEKMLEAVVNLSNALKEVRSYTLEDIAARKQEFKTYAKYCFKAADCIKEVRETAPFASSIIDTVLIEKGIPILDDKIKAMFKEVEKAAGSFCKSSRGTPQEHIARSAYEITKGLKQKNSPRAAEIYFDKKIIPLLEAICELLPETSQSYYNKKIEFNESDEFEQKLETTRDIMQAALVQNENEVKRRKELENENIRSLIKILDRLKDIESNTIKLKIHSYDTKQIILQLQQEIGNLRDFQDKIDSQGQSLRQISTTLDENGSAEVERIEQMRKDLLQLIETLILQSRSTDKKAQQILEDIQKKKKLNLRDFASISADIIQIGSYLNWVLGTPIFQISDFWHLLH